MTTCRCDRGAKIKDIHQNLLKDCSQQGSEKMHSIIIHAGTNNLTNDDLDTTAKEIENLIVDAKLKAKNFAVSSVITRYDNRVPHSRITKFNNLVHECCKKNNISFIDNSNIDRSMLNRSNLHLNNNGDKALGRSLCMYVCMYVCNNEHDFSFSTDIQTKFANFKPRIQFYKSAFMRSFNSIRLLL